MGIERLDPLSELSRLRSMLPSDLTPEQQGALAWEYGDLETAWFAYGVADKIQEIRDRLAL